MSVVPIEEHRIEDTEDGHQIRGYWWTQPRPEIEKKSDAFQKWLLGFLIAAAVLLYFVFIEKERGTTLFLAAIAVTGSACLFLWDRDIRKQRWQVRALAFRTDGAVLVVDESSGPVSARKGYTPFEWQKLKTLDEIANIFMAPTPTVSGGHFKYGRDNDDSTAGYFTSDVIVDFTSGERFYVGSYLRGDDARIVVTQLQQALQGMRDRIGAVA